MTTVRDWNNQIINEFRARRLLRTAAVPAHRARQPTAQGSRIPLPRVHARGWHRCLTVP